LRLKENKKKAVHHRTRHFTPWLLPFKPVCRVFDTI
jgi:hypothetical protein